MKKNVIKKNQVAYQGQNQSNRVKDNDSPFRLELKIPREKLQKELSVLKKEMMGDVEELQNKLSTEQAEFLNSRDNFETEKKQALDEINVMKKRAVDLGHKEGYDDGNKRGYDEGYNKGHTKGQQEFDLIKKEYIKHTKDLFDKLEELNTYKAKIFEKAEPSILKVIDAIIKKVITNEISLNPELTLDIIRDALKKMNDIYKVMIRINPKHASFILDNKERLIKEIGGINNLDISQDSSIHEGGCIIETDYGLIDATIETKMISIMELLNSTYESKLNQNKDTKDVLDNISPEKEGIEILEDDEDLFGPVKDTDQNNMSFLTEDGDDLFDDEESEDEDENLLGDI